MAHGGEEAHHGSGGERSGGQGIDGWCCGRPTTRTARMLSSVHGEGGIILFARPSRGEMGDQLICGSARLLFLLRRCHTDSPHFPLHPCRPDDTSVVLPVVGHARWRSGAGVSSSDVSAGPLPQSQCSVTPPQRMPLPAGFTLRIQLALILGSDHRQCCPSFVLATIHLTSARS